MIIMPDIFTLKYPYEMKSIKLISLCLVLFYIPAISQVGNIIKKVKETTKNETEATVKPKDEKVTPNVKSESDKDNSTQTNVKKSTGSEKLRERNKPQQNTTDKKTKPESTVQIADMNSSVLAPAVAWYSLLDQDHLYYDATSGYFRPHGFHVFFLPEKDIKGEPMNFNKYDSYYPPAMHLDVIDKQNGEKKVTFYYRAEPEILPAYKMKIDDRGTDPMYPAYTNLFEGSYDLKFYINDNHFYTFPINIEKISNKDPYSPVKQLYITRGEWEDWGRIEFNSDGDFIFSHYMPEKDVKVTNQSKWNETIHYPYTAKLLRNGKVIGNYDAQNPQRTLEKGSVFAENGRWVRNQNAFYAYPPVNRRINDNHSHDYVYTKDMTDGNYSVETEIYKPSGTIKSKYTFVIKKGKVVPVPRADRSQHDDKFTLIEQGPNYHYVKKIKN